MAAQSVVSKVADPEIPTVSLPSKTELESPRTVSAMLDYTQRECTGPEEMKETIAAGARHRGSGPNPFVRTLKKSGTDALDVVSSHARKGGDAESATTRWD